MSSAETPVPAEALAAESAAQDRKLPLPLRLFARLENGIIVFALAAMTLLPLLEIVLRKMFNTGVSGSSLWVQHGSLIVGLIGGAVAARRGRLLSLATTALLPRGWPRRLAGIFSGAVSATITLFLCLASIWFVQEEKASAKILAYGVPYWVLELALPIGFALIALRIIWHADDKWWGKSLTALLALLAGAFFVLTSPDFAFWIERESWPTIDPATLVKPALGALLVATALGAPIFTLLGGAALILFHGDLFPITSVPINHYRLVVNPALPTIPLFTLAGYFLAEGGASKRLVRVFSALFGRVRGGPAIVTVLVCAFFTSFTGASGVTILALGGLLMPILLAERYSERAALGLLTGSGAIGMLFPPCLPLILYAIIAEQPIEKMFLAAVGPGMVLVIATGMLGVWMGPSSRQRRFNSMSDEPHASEESPDGRIVLDYASSPPTGFDWREALRAVWEAKWELLLPVVALVSLFSGLATPVEAAAVTALYAFFTQTIIWRDLGIFKDIPRVMTECGLIVGGVLLILGVGLAFTDYLILAQVPDYIVERVTESVRSPWTFLLLLNIVLLVVGCLMDVYSAIIVIVPLLVPIATRFNIDPLHLGIVFLANLELGFLTPPVGMNLFLSSYRFGKPMSAVIRAIIPILIVQLIGVLLITYVPPLTTFLPGLIKP